MKKIICTLFLFIGLGHLIFAQGFLRASGRQIVDESGKNVLLRGIGLGGWMLQEGYMLKLQGTNPQYSIRKRIERLAGPEKTEEFYNSWLRNFITKADIDSLHAWGFNSVRLPMHYNLFTLPVNEESDSLRQTWLTKGFELTDSLLSWCKQNGMYLILDLHAAPGGQGNDFNIADRDSTQPSLWQSEADQIKTIALWKKLAERYKDEPNIGAYDLLNETNWGFEHADDLHGQKETGNQPLRNLFMRITEAIRSVDKKHIVIIEGNTWGNNYKGVFPLWDNNTVISFHKYWNYNDPQSIQSMLDARDQNNAPIWVGETGENSNTWFTDAVSLFEKNNIGWSWWPLKKIGINNPLEVPSNAAYNQLVDYWNDRNKTAPKVDEAYRALLQLAASTNIRSNIVHRDVIDALIRQPFGNETKPFRMTMIGNKDSVIHAVDYDLGRNGFAYSDKDTGNYSVATGRRSAGNRGNLYRNDGVDIFRDSAHEESYYVGSIEEGEWLQYTITVKENARYAFSVYAASDNSAGRIGISIDGVTALHDTGITSTGGAKNWGLQPVGILALKKGTHTIKLTAIKGGFNLKDLVIKNTKL